jgi:hypothetical protein
MLQRRPPPSAHQASHALAQHVGRRVGAPADDEGRERDSLPVTTDPDSLAGVSVQGSRGRAGVLRGPARQVPNAEPYV